MSCDSWCYYYHTDYKHYFLAGIIEHDKANKETIEQINHSEQIDFTKGVYAISRVIQGDFNKLLEHLHTELTQTGLTFQHINNKEYYNNSANAEDIKKIHKHIIDLFVHIAEGFVRNGYYLRTITKDGVSRLVISSSNEDVKDKWIIEGSEVQYVYL